MYRAIGDEGRLLLFRRIAAAGSDGLDADAVDDADGVAVLIEAGLVAPLPMARRPRYRANGGRLQQAIASLLARTTRN